MYKSLIDVERRRLANGAEGDLPSAPAEAKPAPQLIKNRSNILAAAAFASPDDSCEFGSAKYFALCGVGGILSCGITHTMITPLDLVKCRLQVDSAKYKNLINGFKVTLKEEGTRGLGRGWAPTAWGYSAQVSIRIKKTLDFQKLIFIYSFRFRAFVNSACMKSSNVGIPIC